MEFKITGLIKQIKEVQTGTTKAGKDWQKLEFVIENNGGYEGAAQEFCFEIFGQEKVENFTKFNKVGKEVEVSFNIKTNAWKDKHFTTLAAWKIFSAGAETVTPENTVVEEEEDNLPF